MVSDPTKVLQSSTDSKELLTAAIFLARSEQAPDHELLQKYLKNKDFLGRLDTEDDYRQGSSKRLRIARVLEGLGRNPRPTAHGALLALTTDKMFLEEDERVIALIEATVHVRPAPPEFVDFWDKHSEPEDGYTPVTITVLVNNGSEPALRLLEKKLLDPKHEDHEDLQRKYDDKLAWMRSRILTRRDTLPMLEMVERLLKGSLAAELKRALVEVIFDYRPGEWYRPANVVGPPDRSQASPEALMKLRSIGEYARQHLQLTKTQRAAVDATLEGIEKRLPR